MEQAGIVMFAAAGRTSAGAGSTVKVAVVVNVSQSENAVQVTVTEPPQRSGADAGALLVTVVLQPPDAVTLVNQVAYAVLICACVEQAGVVMFAAAGNTKAGAGSTVNVAVVVRVSQSLNAVQVTVTEPPQRSGADAGALLVTVVLQPPDAVTLVNHVA